MAVQRPRICVLGAGISGLSTAIQIQNSGFDAIVTIVADKFLSETTSTAAAGMCVPFSLMDTPEHLQRRWCNATFKRLEELYMSKDCAQAGVSEISGYMIFKDDELLQDPQILDPFWKDIVKNFHVLSEDDMKMFPSYRKGLFFTTFLSQSLPYLEFLTEGFKGKGGQIIKRKIHHLEELSDDYDIIVNCSGALTKDLLEDKEIEAVRGQVAMVQAPWVKHFYLVYDAYIIPAMDGVFLGGIHQSGRWDTGIDLKDKTHILKGTADLLPSLQGAQVVNDKVGLRPSRTSVRLERQNLVCEEKKKRVPVIHNYGHGGSGFTLHWGCSLDAAKLVVEAAREIIMQSKL